jgi:hypothetical protein
MARSFDEVKKSTIKCFERSFPGEPLNISVFSEWCLCLYCELVVNYEAYRETVRNMRKFLGDKD